MNLSWTRGRGLEPSLRQPTTPLSATPSTCVCGQPLELWHARHCPRCGVELTPPAAPYPHNEDP